MKFSIDIRLTENFINVILILISSDGDTTEVPLDLIRNISYQLKFLINKQAQQKIKEVTALLFCCFHTRQTG